MTQARRATCSLFPLFAMALASVTLGACDKGAPAGGEDAKTAAKADVKADAKADAAKAGAAKADTSKASPSEARGATKAGKATAHAETIASRVPPKLDSEQAESGAATFATTMETGRAAMEAKKYDEAIAQFEAGLKLDPNHPGALGELGWAAYRKGDLILAHASTMKAMTHVKTPQHKGALLYNLGRIEEAQGKLEHALDLYHRSLSVHEDAAVSARVVELEAQLAAADAPPPAPTYTSIQALCEAELLELVYCPSEDEAEEGDGCGCSAEKTLKNPNADATLVSAAIVSVGSVVAGMGVEEYGYLAIETKTRGWQLVSQVGDGSEPGLSYIHNAWSLETFEFRSIEAEGEQALVVAVERVEADGDYIANAVEFADYTDMWTCYTGEPSVRCVAFEIASDAGLEKMLEGGQAPDVEEWGPLGNHKYTVKVSFADGKVVLEDAGVPSEERAPHTGAFSLAELATADWTELIELH